MNADELAAHYQAGIASVTNRRGNVNVDEATGVQLTHIFMVLVEILRELEARGLRWSDGA